MDVGLEAAAVRVVVDARVEDPVTSNWPLGSLEVVDTLEEVTELADEVVETRTTEEVEAIVLRDVAAEVVCDATATVDLTELEAVEDVPEVLMLEAELTLLVVDAKLLEDERTALLVVLDLLIDDTAIVLLMMVVLALGVTMAPELLLEKMLHFHDPPHVLVAPEPGQA